MVEQYFWNGIVQQHYMTVTDKNKTSIKIAAVLRNVTPRRRTDGITDTLLYNAADDSTDDIDVICQMIIKHQKDIEIV